MTGNAVLEVNGTLKINEVSARAALTLAKWIQQEPTLIDKVSHKELYTMSPIEDPILGGKRTYFIHYINLGFNRPHATTAPGI